MNKYTFHVLGMTADFTPVILKVYATDIGDATVQMDEQIREIADHFKDGRQLSAMLHEVEVGEPLSVVAGALNGSTCPHGRLSLSTACCD